MGDRGDLVDLRLFGTPRVQRDGRAVSFDTRKALALLAVLGESGIAHSRESLAGMLWPELDGTRARAALRRTLSVTSAIGPCLVTTPTTVGLDSSLLRCDVQEFRHGLTAADTEERARAAAVAVDGFLAGFALRDSAVFEDWQLATADLLRDELSQLLASLVTRRVEDGDLSAALAFARRRVQIDALSEPAHADLIRVLAWSGDRPGALAAYRALVRLLDRELGVPPLPRTMALHDDIRGDRLQAPAVVGTPPRLHAPRARRPVDALVGREQVLTELDVAWRASISAGRSIALVGEPGVGKTALARRLAERSARGGAVVLSISAHAAEQGLAFVAAADLLRGLIAAHPALLERLDGADEPLAALAPISDLQGAAVIRTPGDLRRLHEAVRAVIAEVGRTRRVLIVVDDAQLLDAPSATLLAYVVRRPPPGTLLVATWARGAGEAELPVAVLEAGEVLPVEPLGLAAVAELLGDHASEAEAVLQRTRGVPLLVREYAAAGGGIGGGGARELVAARLDAAPELTRQVVGAAAVIATVADPELLRAACGRDEAETVDAIEDAIARGLLVERADRPGYDVPHDLVRDLALDGLSLARTRLLHGRIADLLVRRRTVDPLAAPAGAVARHLAGAGRDAEAGAWYLTAAGVSTRLAAHAEALEQLEAALALGHAPLDVRAAMGAALVRLGRYAEALVAFDQAVALAEGDVVRQSAIEHAIAGVHDRLGDWELARAHLEAARDLTPPDLIDRRGRILADLALVEHRRGRPAEAAALATETVRIATAAGDHAALAQALNVLGVVEQARGHRDIAVARLTRAVALAREIDDRDLEIAALNNLSHAALAIGDLTTATVHADAALERAEQQGDLHRLAALRSHMADLLHAAGREEEAIAQLRSSASAFSEVQGAALRPEVWTLTEW